MRSCSAALAEMFGEVVRRLRPLQQQRQPPHVRQGARSLASLCPSRCHSATSSAARPRVSPTCDQTPPTTPKELATSHSRREYASPDRIAATLSIRIMPVIICDNTHKANRQTLSPCRNGQQNARPNARSAGQARRKPPPRPYFLSMRQPAVYPHPFRKS